MIDFIDSHIYIGIVFWKFWFPMSSAYIRIAILLYDYYWTVIARISIENAIIKGFEPKYTKSFGLHRFAFAVNGDLNR